MYATEASSGCVDSSLLLQHVADNQDDICIHTHTHTHMRARKQHHCHRPSTSETPSELPNNKCRYRHCCGATVISGLFEESSRNTKEQHSQQQQQQHTQLTSLFTYSAVCIYMELRALPPVSRAAGAKRVLGWRVTTAAVHASKHTDIRALVRVCCRHSVTHSLIRCSSSSPSH